MNSQETTEALGNMSVGAATGMSIVAFIEQHANFFTVLIGVAGLIAAIIFYTLNYRLNRKFKQKDYELKRQQAEKDHGHTSSRSS